MNFFLDLFADSGFSGAFCGGGGVVEEDSTSSSSGGEGVGLMDCMDQEDLLGQLAAEMGLPTLVPGSLTNNNPSPQSSSSDEDVAMVHPPRESRLLQVWSQNQFHHVGFLQSRTSVKMLVFSNNQSLRQLF